MALNFYNIISNEIINDFPYSTNKILRTYPILDHKINIYHHITKVFFLFVLSNPRHSESLNSMGLSFLAI